MYYGEIKRSDIADGEGVRTSLFVSGCRNHCKGCFNPETWDFTYGKEFTEETANDVLAALAPDYIQGLTLLGGDPMEEENQRGLIELLRRVKREYPDKDIWCYTGYLADVDLVKGGKKYTEVTDEMMGYFDVIVDGPFVEELKDIRLTFRGSSNQRIIRK